MNREIKFRAWHNIDEGKQMTEGVQPLTSSLTNDSNKLFCMIPMLGIVFHEATGRKRYWYEIEVDAIMQFTGLKDKNGKDIYEGDIIRYDLPAMNDMQEDNEECNGEVKFIQGCFEVDSIPLYATLDWECEVVGNVYENPELLNKLQNAL